MRYLIFMTNILLKLSSDKTNATQIAFYDSTMNHCSFGINKIQTIHNESNYGWGDINLLNMDTYWSGTRISL